ncbi:aggregation-promoting factor C-terminal-like domain-containing protein [Microbacterium sp. CGR1]|uniref:aggregation-promoting factor C-terminal-like domain-containing protein n=1 Tax=Microbacterium sp. CGR1 TaxID=1696072 RepID=UPI00069EED14|nr:phospholipase [Microbacterium sp. CGR1]
MLHTTRALRRAHAAATARNAITARRPKLILGTITGGMLGLALTVGIVSAPAAGAELPDAVAGVTSFVTGEPDAPAKSADDSALTMVAAQDAVAAAEALNAEVAASGLDLGAAPSSVDTADVTTWVDQLADRDDFSNRELSSLTAYAVTGTDEIVAETAALQASYVAAQEAKAAADAAAAQAAAEAAALAQTNTVDGAKAAARDIASSEYGWGEDQFSCLNSLWTKESGWNYKAYNASGGATGIPQALPGSKMASAGSDWQTNAATQIRWGLGYISSVYGTPCSAWGHSQSVNWY